MRLQKEQWTIDHLRDHLQAAVDLEFWTIPFYMSALYSITDRSSDAFEMIQSVLNQEMLHVQLASNIANAYGLSPTFQAPVYEGTTIPHLDFSLDTPNPTETYCPYSAEIGPLDEARLNAMCLIEYPEWETGGEPSLNDTVSEYGSIGEFYEAVTYGAGLLVDDLHGGVNQVNFFSAFYNRMPTQVVAGDGAAGLKDAVLLVNCICGQGEGGSEKRDHVPLAFENTADDSNPGLSHFQKFTAILESAAKPLTYPLKANPTPADLKYQDILVEEFTTFRAILEDLFSGKAPSNFGSQMVLVGAAIQNCWKNGVLPRFS